MSQPNPKLRPYLSVTEIESILTLTQSSTDPIHKSIHRTLSQSILKYSAGFTKGSYVPSPRPTLGSSLGLDAELRYMNNEMSEEEEREYEANLMRGS